MLPGPTPGTDLRQVQRRRKHALMFGIAASIALLVPTASSWRTSEPRLYELIEDWGMFLIVLCVLGRTWCTLYIGGIKKRELVCTGPYSVVRNPLYTFTVIGAAGIGAQSGGIAATLILAAGTLLIFYVVVRQEEQFLSASFPDAFADYAARVPRFLPKFSLWRDSGELVVRPDLVRRTFLDGSLFLLAIPIADLIDWGQDSNWLRVLLHLP